MKRNLLLPMFIALIAMACSSEPGDEGTDTGKGEKSVVKLTIYDGTHETRAAGTQIETPVGTESDIDASLKLKVVVFNSDGSLDFPKNPADFPLDLDEPTPGVYESKPFTVEAGLKYFYIFVNDGSPGLVNLPSTTIIRSQFIAQSIPATLTLSTGDLNLAGTNFLMGTLWSETTMAPSGGTPASPLNIDLSIGRLASKVNLKGVTDNLNIMAGTFKDPVYRLGTIPKKIFVVGNNVETLPTPPASGHGVVRSVVHEALPFTGSGDANFEQYNTVNWKSVDNPYYTVENTTAPDADGLQYYGNTTYIQIRTVYEPNDNEVSDVNTLSPQNSFSGPTFYTALLISDGTRLIFDKDPRVPANNPHPDIDLSSVLEYTDGENYHKFPIYDDESGLDEVQKNAVLRNHSYTYAITGINDIGSPTDYVDPQQPIETITTLTIKVNVLDWSKIENLGMEI